MLFLSYCIAEKRRMVQPLESNAVPVRVLRWYGNTLFHQVLGVIAVTATWYGWVNNSATISWHVILCTVGVSM